MPYGAFPVTVTAPPLAPLLSEGLGGVLDGEGAGWVGVTVAGFADVPVVALADVAAVFVGAVFVAAGFGVADG
jgi:hypothetical protein